jgi:hypothetical protein
VSHLRKNRIKTSVLTYEESLRRVEALITERDGLAAALATAEVQLADLRARIERADRELERADAIPALERVREIVMRMRPNERGALLEELARMHRQLAPLSKTSVGS